jgi:hypothetical protein
MTATFLLPFAVGACAAVGGNIAEDAFGVVAMVAMTPLIAIQILGLVYKLKSRKAQKTEVDTTIVGEDGQITIDFNGVETISEELQSTDVNYADEDIIDF